MNVKRKATSSISAAVSSPSAPKKLRQGSLTSFFAAPAGHNLHTGPKVRFDKDAWVNGLTPPQKELLKYEPCHFDIYLIKFRLEIDTLHESWLAVLKDELTKPYFLKVFCFNAKTNHAAQRIP